MLDTHLQRKRSSVQALVAASDRLGAAARRLAAAPDGATPRERQRAVADAAAQERQLRASYRATWSAALREGWTPRELISMDLSAPLPPRHRR